MSLRGPYISDNVTESAEADDGEVAGEKSGEEEGGDDKLDYESRVLSQFCCAQEHLLTTYTQLAQVTMATQPANEKEALLGVELNVEQVCLKHR